MFWRRVDFNPVLEFEKTRNYFHFVAAHASEYIIMLLAGGLAQHCYYLCSIFCFDNFFSKKCEDNKGVFRLWGLDS